MRMTDIIVKIVLGGTAMALLAVFAYECVTTPTETLTQNSWWGTWKCVANVKGVCKTVSCDTIHNGTYGRFFQSVPEKSLIYVGKTQADVDKCKGGK